ncbi:MAG: Bug family tripartite tricarboxylate transporter substrate binding protein [Burkholderiales bacterium]
MRSILRGSGLLSLCLCVTGSVHAQSFPSKTIRLVVGYQPGGAADMVTRVVAKVLTDKLGQQVIVDNRPGAGGFIANEMVAKAPPDGYALLLANSSFAYIPGMFTNLKFNTRTDFTPVALVATTQNVLVVHPAVPVKNVKDLVALARTNPAKLSYASGGTGGSTHMATELFKSMTHTKILHVPYKGNGPSIVDLISGQVDITIAPIPAMLPFISGGSRKLKPLATSGLKRTSMLPDLPTIAESGVPGYDAGSWYGYMLPAKTPPAIVATLEREIVAVGNSPAFAEALKSGVGAEPSVLSSEKFRELVALETEKWGKIIKDAGIRGE